MSLNTFLWIIAKLKHRKTYIGYNARISNCKIGLKCRIFRQARLVNCTLGDNTHVGCEAVVRNADIGDNVGIAERAIVGVFNRKNQRVKIGNDVMIGAGLSSWRALRSVQARGLVPGLSFVATSVLMRLWLATLRNGYGSGQGMRQGRKWGKKTLKYIWFVL